MSDVYIEEAVDFCVKEVGNLRKGLQGIDMLEYAWERGIA